MSADSILTSVKKLLGLSEDCLDFDMDVIINVNSAIETLRQLGVNISEDFSITSEEDTYEDLLGSNINLSNQVKLYLYYKTRLGFDPPTNSYLVDQIRKEIAELEWRINARVDPRTTFDGGGEIQNDG